MLLRNLIITLALIIVGGIILYFEGRPIHPEFSGCDRNATTADCAVITSQQPVSPHVFRSPATTTATISHFSFEYPGTAFLSGFGWEGVSFPGDFQINELDSEGHSIYIFTKPAPLSSIDPSAISLSDYEKDYPISATGTRPIYINGQISTVEVRRQVHILSTESLTIHNISMLRQRYSIGVWTPNSQGDIIFDASDESSANNWLRYVFFDGESFAVITGWQDDSWIDSIAKSIRLTP